MRQKELVTIHDGNEVLRRVTGAFWWSEDPSETPMLMAVVLEFDRTRVAFIVGDEDSLDPCDYQSFTSRHTCHQMVDITSTHPWTEAIGLPLLWSWVMLNQQGYNDGVQLEFSQDGGSVSVIVQMIGVASEVKIRHVSPGFISMPRSAR